MEEGGSVWGNLGMNMSLPSTVREDIERMKLELRDLKLMVSKDIVELRDTVVDLNRRVANLIDRQSSLLTRIEGLEVRAQNVGVSKLSEEFNAFAYVGLDEILEDPEDDGAVMIENVEEEEEEEEFDEVVAAEKIYVTVKNRVIEDGCILNNKLHTLYGDALGKDSDKVTKKVKDFVKELLSDDRDVIALKKLDRFRTLYYRDGEDPDELYESVYGGK
mgnify:CR=1 FL=1